MARLDLKKSRADVAAASMASMETAPTPTSTAIPIIPTLEQQACWDHMHHMLTNDSPNLVVNAVAGSGKTFTALEGAKRLQWAAQNIGRRGRLDIRYLAFNKSVQAEMQVKAGDSLTAQTFHSFGLRAITQQFGPQPINKDRAWKVLDRVEGMSKDKRVRGGVVKLIRLVKQYGVGVGEEWRDGVWDIIDKHGLELADSSMGDEAREAMEEEIVGWVPRVVAASMELVKGEGVDFDDMIWLPYAHGLRLGQAELLVVDEAQDLNLVQQWFAVESGERVVVIGDRNQAIYAFRGADSKSIDRLAEAVGAKELMLTVTRRCPVRVVELAQKIVPHIRAWDGAGEGVVEEIGRAQLLQGVVEGDMVLCRNNAPLVSLAFQLIKAGKPARIRGRDVHDGIMELLRKSGAGVGVGKLSKVLMAAQQFTDDEVERFEAMKEGRGEERAARALDRLECLLACAGGCTTVEELTVRLGELFREDRTGIVLSSVHKAKGLESDRVWVLEPGLLGMRRGNQNEEQYQQELNLAYVAVTRARRELRFVGEVPRVLKRNG